MGRVGGCDKNFKAEETLYYGRIARHSELYFYDFHFLHLESTKTDNFILKFIFKRSRVALLQFILKLCKYFWEEV